MKEHCVGALPVVWDKADPLVEGIITDRDLCCGIAGDARDSDAVLVSELMTRVPVTCEPDFTIEECLRLIEENQVRRIPVVDQRGRCVGIVTQVDIARKIPPAQVAEMISEISKPMSKERERLFEKDHYYRGQISTLIAKERDSPSEEDYFYFGRTHEEDEILLLRQRRTTRMEMLEAA
jgi:signal-transduction protein with cAMP-binding, CBS, and nucleotidyltransferase domain